MTCSNVKIMKPTIRRLLDALLISLIMGISFPSHPQEQLETIGTDPLKGWQQLVLRNYAAATWQTFVKLTSQNQNGIPADNYSVNEGYARYTSPTNIGVYIWSVLAARDLYLITSNEARKRLATTLESLATMDRYRGQFYNWYDPVTLEPTETCPFLSTVDNGWLAAALIMVINGAPELREEAYAILKDMDFGLYYDQKAGLLYGGYSPKPTSKDCDKKGPTDWHYDILNTEPRIASYIGIAMGSIPATHYFKPWRTFPNTCDWSWQEMKPEGEEQTYLGVSVFEGTYRYMGMKLVPSWGGSMFEALMVPLLVPEETWGPQSWGVNHPLYVQAQILHGLTEAQYGFWGFSPTTNPSSTTGDYGIYGVDAIGMWDVGYASNNDNTLVDYGFGSCPNRNPQPIPQPPYTNGIVAPHAAFLALRFAPQATFKNLDHLRLAFPKIFDEQWGFWSSVNVQTGEVSGTVLALDQGMVMAALGNALTQDNLRRYFTQGAIETVIRPLLAIETFTAGE